MKSSNHLHGLECHSPKQGIELNHWVKGSKELIEQQEFEEDGTPKPYFSKI